MDTEQFIKRAMTIHGDRYDYSRTIYKRIDRPVVIGCKEHGYFEQTPHTHLIYESGCQTCSRQRTTHTTELFIERAIAVHGDRYDYSKVTYVNNKTKVEITCHVHGPFFQLPTNHIARRAGCSSCRHSEGVANRRLTQDQFLDRAKQIHHGKYTYPGLSFASIKDYITIKCPTHGEFQQRVTNHINMKQGCPACGYQGCYTEHFFACNPEYKDLPGTIYCVQFASGEESFTKVGITKRSTNERFRSNSGYTVQVLIERSMPLYECYKLEQQIKKAYMHCAYTPSRKIGGDTECFNLTSEQTKALVDQLLQ